MNLKEIKISGDRTHHLYRGKPLYSERFDSVEKFHPPGLAPVRKGGKAWHIRTDGSRAYSHHFSQAFGFYEGKAAVASSDGWFHILPDGSPLYEERYDWCGNFQENRCTVRDHSQQYFHIDGEGRAVYREKWKYAGDFRDGIAVVQREDGLSTHIDPDGNFVHGKWFLDLDVFHKGLARARDQSGWTHIDRDGRPAYQRRFAAVEPFYNGQARVELFDGSLEVIDQTGKTIVQLRPPLKSQFHILSAELVGYWKTLAIGTAVKLGIFEHLPAPTEKLAHLCQLPHPSAERLLEALAELQLVERKNSLWSATQRGVFLRRNHPQTLAPAALEYAGPLLHNWFKLPEALKLGEKWEPPDFFARAAEDPERVVLSSQMLQSYAKHDYQNIAKALDWSIHSTIIDAGGGTGTIALSLLKAYPSLEVILLERSEIVEQIEVPADIKGRLRLKAADIFSPWNLKADGIILARVLHDWNDQKALTILKRAKESLAPDGKLYLIEMLRSGYDGALCDLHLLVNTGGSERKLSQYQKLLQQAGFKTERVIKLDSIPSILIATHC